MSNDKDPKRLTGEVVRPNTKAPTVQEPPNGKGVVASYLETHRLNTETLSVEALARNLRAKDSAINAKEKLERTKARLLDLDQTLEADQVKRNADFKTAQAQLNELERTIGLKEQDDEIASLRRQYEKAQLKQALQELHAPKPEPEKKPTLDELRAELARWNQRWNEIRATATSEQRDEYKRERRRLVEAIDARENDEGE